MVHQRSQRILAQSGFAVSFDAPWSELSWISDPSLKRPKGKHAMQLVRLVMWGRVNYWSTSHGFYTFSGQNSRIQGPRSYFEISRTFFCKNFTSNQAQCSLTRRLSNERPLGMKNQHFHTFCKHRELFALFSWTFVFTGFYLLQNLKSIDIFQSCKIRSLRTKNQLNYFKALK